MSSRPACKPTSIPLSDEAFYDFVAAYKSRVFRLCCRILDDAAEAEDATQETFLRAYLHRHLFDPSRSLSTWLQTIAAHYCIDRLRRRHFHWTCLDGVDWATHPGLCEPSSGPEEALIQKEQDLEMRLQLDRLPRRDREAIVLHYWGRLSCAEVAQAMGSSVPAVKSLLHRGRSRLCRLLRRPYSFAWEGSRLNAASLTVA
jgi:RNA polymerase sigma-70 factor (ECF subfamily)